MRQDQSPRATPAAPPPDAAAKEKPARPRPPRALLLELPAELRQLILAEALRDPAGVAVDDARLSYQHRKTLGALLQVSRAVRIEAFAVFAAQNAFVVDNASGLLHLLRVVGADGRAQLRHADVVFSRPTGRGFVDDQDALKGALVLLREATRFKMTVELALRAVMAPWNHAHETDHEQCYHFPNSAKNKAGKNFWIHPVSVCDTPSSEDIQALVQSAAVVRWSGSPQYSWSSSEDDSMDFIRKSEQWLRPPGPDFKYVCSWETPIPPPRREVRRKD